LGSAARGEEKIDITILEAPATFGDIALWYKDVKSDFTARSNDYAEIAQLSVAALLSIAKRDQNIRSRYRAYREAMHEFDKKENGREF
jgi:hypothetical protein